MKAVILAGGLGTRLSEETEMRPKPMVEIGGRPMLWHIMKIYSSHGVEDFIIPCGFKGYVIKEYFANYSLHQSDVTIDIRGGAISIHQSHAEPWKVTLVDTGETTMTGGRLKRVAEYLDDGPFCFTYGDGVGNIDVRGLLRFHSAHGLLATVTAVRPPGRFGAIRLDDRRERVESFKEKPEGDGVWVNGGFFVLSPRVVDYIKDDYTRWEDEPMERLAAEGHMAAYLHKGHWQCMDTLRDKQLLQEQWDSGDPPWRNW